MQPMDDSLCLRHYVEHHSDVAFGVLVARYVNLVYSVALRQTGNPHDAEEITQAVFIILAQKAGQLRHEKALSSWLFQATRLTAVNFVRGKIRRQIREQEAFMQTVSETSADPVWPQIAPLLDTAVAGLREVDRRAILLRFYEGRNLREVGLALGASEAAAEKRVHRALEKLRKFFSKRGVTFTTAMLAGAISTHSAQAAPVGLAQTVTAVAVAKGVTTSTSTFTLIQGALKIMAWSKTQMTATAALVAVLAVGTTLTVKEVRAHQTYPWQQARQIDRSVLDQLPPQVRILPGENHPYALGWGSNPAHQLIGLGVDFKTLIQAAYSYTYGTKHLERITSLAGWPPGRFDFIATLPAGSPEALQREIQRQFGLVARLETRDTPVLVLTLQAPAAPGRVPSQQSDNVGHLDPGRLALSGTDMGGLLLWLAGYFQVPVLDRTGLAGHFDLLATWDEPVRHSNPDGFKAALRDQLGLELTATNQPLEMLVVDKAP